MQADFDLAELAQLMRMAPPQLGPMGLWRFALRNLSAGEALFRQGDRFRSVYVVRSGFFRSVHFRGGEEHVVAFPMQGDALGMDGMGEAVHPVGTTALTSAQVAVVPYALLEQMDWLHGAPGEILLRLLCRENACKSAHLFLLGYRTARERAAVFLLQQSERMGRLGYSHTAYPLPMRHADIANFLGLRAETLSRAFTALGTEGLVGVGARAVDIHDAVALRAVAEGGRPARAVCRRERARPARLRPATTLELQ